MLVYTFCVWESTFSVCELLAHLSPLTVRENKEQKGSNSRQLQRKCAISKGKERQNVCWVTQYFDIENDGN